MAYVLSNIIVTNILSNGMVSYLCNGQRLVKFDPLNFKTTP